MSMETGSVMASITTSQHSYKALQHKLAQAQKGVESMAGIVNKVTEDELYSLSNSRHGELAGTLAHWSFCILLSNHTPDAT